MRARNVALILYSLANIAAGGALIWYGYFPSMRYPMLLMIAAHLFVLWQVAIRVSLRDQPAGLPGQALIDFLKGESERQRDALSAAWLWYIFPFMPAFLWELGIWANAILSHPDGAAKTGNIRLFALVVVAAILFWGAVWLFFARGAKRLKGQIDALDRLRGE
ncbi:MAG TPA: hypothetical protein VN932_10620 [Rhizomicrobium sp.]|nr:hypothetical protein [Rhizomicrobium sp.]